MKRITIILLVSLVASASAISQTQTKQNLLTAWKGETTASSKYAAYADQAAKEGYPQIASLFRAASKSEGIHAANHKTVLGKMGGTTPAFTPEFTVKTTKENLADAISGEGNEVMKMYPDYITIAKSEEAMDAAKSMRWAMETEKKHLGFFSNAMKALESNNVASLVKFYWVCPKCGNTYDVDKPESMCSFCGTSSSKFSKVQ